MLIDQGSLVEATVVQMFNQGTIPKKGCNPCLPAGRFFGGLFFGYFFWTTCPDASGSKKSNKQ
jgi:hypothetical protein